MQRQRSLGNIINFTTLSPVYKQPICPVSNPFFPSKQLSSHKKQNINILKHHKHSSSQFSVKTCKNNNNQQYFPKQKFITISKVKKGHIKINISGKNIIQSAFTTNYRQNQFVLKTPKSNININMSLNALYSPGDQLNRTLTNISNISSTPTNKIKPPIKGTPGQQPKRPKLLNKPKQRSKYSNDENQFRYSQSNNQPILQFQQARTLGSGQFGSVTMVQHIPTKTVYAMKRMRIKGGTAKLIERISEQIKIQSYLDHQNCLKLYKAYRQDDDIVLILQLGSCSLFDRLRQKKFFSQKQACYYLRQVINALKYMHEQGVIHRDIKPQNIVLINNNVKLADFGWSIYTDKKKRTTFCGTLDYVSPQLVVGCQYDQMVDVWSVGVLCYQLCTGHAPFQCQQNTHQTYKKILDVDLKFPKHLSTSVKSFISGLLVKIPSSRMSLDQALNHPWMKQYQNSDKKIK